MMLEKMLKTFQKLRLEFYRKIFTRVRERDGSLSAMEVFSLEIIYALGRPTIGQFARFIGISQSNATYKVNSLMKKGYIIRQPSQEAAGNTTLSFPRSSTVTATCWRKM